uniref:[Protein ADP-ribosylarginine] hydrolase-like n=1 Tax=Callorhinchus milii TaxID=7868 RepID=A0A4W3IST5_CALMI
LSERLSETEKVYEAAMLLSAVGDALGYRNARWEFCESGEQIHSELEGLGCLGNIHVCLPHWPVSDDTVLHLASAQALNTGTRSQWGWGYALLHEFAAQYVEAMKDMKGRKPGPTRTSQLTPGEPLGFQIPFNPKGVGCGAAMRSMCIGLRYPRPEQLPHLVRVSIDSGRMTPNHPTGYLGALASALFNSNAVQGRPLREWGFSFLQTLPLALDSITSSGRDVPENLAAWNYFPEKWELTISRWYLKQRGLEAGSGGPRFPPVFGPPERDVEYRTFSLDGWAGRSGHDAPMIAYDALLGAGASWEELCSRAAFHGGDSDSTAVISLEYWDRLVQAARQLHQSAWE